MGKKQGDGGQTLGAGHQDCLSVHTELPENTEKSESFDYNTIYLIKTIDDIITLQDTK